jgi:hypothetical protein
MYSIHPRPSQMGFAPVKPHGFPTFLHGKTTVFPTPFPKVITFLQVLPPKGDKNAAHIGRLKGRPYEKRRDIISAGSPTLRNTIPVRRFSPTCKKPRIVVV